MNNFITNDKERSLHKRLEALIHHSKTLKFLVGFFYFSGWQTLIDSMQNNPDAQLKVLVGLSVDKLISNSYFETSLTTELAIDDSSESNDERFDHFLHGLRAAINHPERDTKMFYEQVGFFIQCLESGRLQLRKTEKPNHAKLYLFCLKQQGVELINQNGCFITGSSNLTQAGLTNQQEFNVEIKDYGFDSAEVYFDNLWENALEISEDVDYKKKILNFFTNESLCATVTPYEAYALVLKTYLDLQQAKELSPRVERLLENNGFEKYQYQLDAVRQAVGILDKYNGVIIADVVGLGKSVIASMIGAHYGERGLLICPPGLMGDEHKKDSGWQEYKQKFELFNWDICSVGKIDDLADNPEQLKSYEIIIVDEAHRFRNQDSKAFESLSTICRNKKVVLLTATPFNNSPADIFALLKLFVIPKHSGLTIDGDLDKVFTHFNNEFKNLSILLRDLDSPNSDKAEKARKVYQKQFNDKAFDSKKVQSAFKQLSTKIKKTISPVIIRRNRLDLLNDYEYKEEIGELSYVKDPEEQFFQLTPEQSIFYDAIIRDYFAKENARFKGAIYTPALYQQGLNKEKLSEEENRSVVSQKNLFDFMRRLLVKRFESAFGAFEQTIQRFEKVHQMALQLVEDSGQYILDRKIMEKFYNEDTRSFDDLLALFEEFVTKAKTAIHPKQTEIYDVEKFADKQKFIEHIRSDLLLFTEIKNKINSLNLVENDPKTRAVIERIQNVLAKPAQNGEPKRKIILFSEYTDTVVYLQQSFEKIADASFNQRVLFCHGAITSTNRQQLLENFDAKYTHPKDDFDVLVATDKLSEGFNFNRAGLIINYDIPWNPTRVIQRVGRINRMSAKVFDELQIDNFFPSEQGATVVKSREIAMQKMLLIHNALGEDAKILDEGEDPQASELFEKIKSITQESEESENLTTVIRNAYSEVDEQTKARISKLPSRVKTAKITGDTSQNNKVLVLQRKGLALFGLSKDYLQENPRAVDEIEMESFISHVKCEPETERKYFSPNFWQCYEDILAFRSSIKTSAPNAQSLGAKSLNRLKSFIEDYKKKQLMLSEKELKFIQTLIKDIRDYKTLPDYTLRELCKESNQDLKETIVELQHHLGNDYLDLAVKRASHIDEDIVIAVENIGYE